MLGTKEREFAPIVGVTLEDQDLESVLPQSSSERRVRSGVA